MSKLNGQAPNMFLDALTRRSGLGELLSTTFAKEGANIAINYFNRIEPAQKVQKACQEQGVKAVIIQAVGWWNCKYSILLY
jgi:hypothetical protein